MIRKAGLAAFVLGVNLSQAGLAAAASPSELCDLAAQDAAKNHDIPVKILLAITRVETGRTSEGVLLPWPWAINSGGSGQWFDTPQSAIAAAEDAVARGVQNFDVGCFQLNWRWHGAAFASVEDMFDPGQNADYAARFLSDLYLESGDWAKAVATYHSRSDEPAERYLARVEEVLQGWSGSTPVPVAVAAPRENRFPLLQAGGGRGSGGSLVPLVLASGRFIDSTGQSALVP